MLDSVLDNPLDDLRQELSPLSPGRTAPRWARRSVSAGIAVSLLVHAGLIAAAIYWPAEVEDADAQMFLRRGETAYVVNLQFLRGDAAAGLPGAKPIAVPAAAPNEEPTKEPPSAPTEEPIAVAPPLPKAQGAPPVVTPARPTDSDSPRGPALLHRLRERLPMYRDALASIIRSAPQAQRLLAAYNPREPDPPAAPGAPVDPPPSPSSPGASTASPTGPAASISPATPGAREPAGATGTPGTPGVPTGAAILDLPEPRYPALSIRGGEEGTIVLEIEVLEDGRAGEVRIARSPGFVRLERAAIDAVTRARFRPALRDGRPVRQVITKAFRFELKDARDR